MNLELQVTSLELSKKLKELGEKQESLFYYLNIDGEGKYYIYYNESFPEEFEYEGDPIAAFTYDELMEILPALINSSFLRIIKQYDLDENIEYIVIYEGLATFFVNKKLCAALAQMRIYLIENGLVRYDYEKECDPLR